MLAAHNDAGVSSPLSADILAAPAYAKVNLTLGVAPPEPPLGYHPICSHFACISLADDVTVTLLRDRAAGHITLDAQWAADALRQTAIDWPAEKDLAVRAAHAATAALALGCGMHITLRKRIPAGGGLGGGSSDAGTVLRLLAQHASTHRRAAAHELLLAAAHKLGSDVPFFCDLGVEPPQPPRQGVVSGLGERIRRAGTVTGTITLLIPRDIACPTGQVYRAFDALPKVHSGEHTIDIAHVDALAGRSTLSADGLFNDLAEPAMQVAPDLRRLAGEAAACTGERVHVSGSGSTLFIVGDVSGQLATAAAVRSDELATLVCRVL